jgi:urea transport system substrate-binding protein
MNKYFNKKTLKYFFVLLIIILIIFLINKNIYKHTIKVGILFTTSVGAMATNEKRLYDITNETIDLYNNSQNKIYLEKYIYSPESTEETYIKGAEYLLNKDLSLVFGCWRSADRKAVLPIFEKHNNLLCYPVQYEGNECSKNILYFGACPNQQINIGIEYGIKNISTQIILIGSDYVFPRTANKIMNDYIHNLNAELLDEIYVSMDEKNFDNITDKIISRYKNQKIVIMNTINGDSNKYFFESLFKIFKTRFTNSILSEVFTVMSFSLTENDCFEYKLEYIFGHYFIWNYSQLDISYDEFLKNGYLTNSKIQNILIKNIKDKNIIIDDPMYHSFLAVLFFVNFLEKYEGNYSSEDIRNKYLLTNNNKVLTPTGYLTIEASNHLQQPVYILQTDKQKRFKTIYKTPVEIHPNPWFNKFSKKHYECNNDFNFLGNKFLTTILF